MSVIERAHADIAAGRLWLARDRLTGALAHRPHDAAVIDLLADVYLQMGDAPAAGRMLMLSERDDEVAREARETFSWLRRGHSYNLAKAVPAKLPLEAYQPGVHDRLEQLAAQVKADGFRQPWTPPGSVARHPDDSVGGGLMALGCAAAFLVPWIAGAVFLGARLVDWLF